jgi:RND superfamily putative drug exporter
MRDASAGFAVKLRSGDRARRNLAASSAQSPGLTRSGYFALSALDGARRDNRLAASFVVNLASGGQAARMIVIPRTGATDPETMRLRDDLSQAANLAAGRSGMEAAVGGAAAVFHDFGRISRDRLPLLILAISLVTYLVLVPVFRSLLLPAIAVILNLLTVAAGFGVLALLFDGRAPLGGPGYVDTISSMLIFAVIFGLSIDYEVFLISRMREGYLRTGDTESAISYGLERTAGVVTGAAAIMTTVFIGFASTSVATIRQTGTGLVVAVLLDATAVRLVLLPAVMRLSGRWNWWLPPWLQRRLPSPGVDHVAPRAVALIAPHAVPAGRS